MELVPKSVVLVLLPREPHPYRANSRIQANSEPGLRGMGSEELVSFLWSLRCTDKAQGENT